MTCARFNSSFGLKVGEASRNARVPSLLQCFSNQEGVRTQQDTRSSSSSHGEQSMRSEFHFMYLARTSMTPKPEVMATGENARDPLRLVIANRRVRQSGSARIAKIDARMNMGWDHCVNPSQRRPETFCT